MARSIGSGARITYDQLFATPHELLCYGGYLTGPHRGSAVAIARAWINAHRQAFGLTAAAVRTLAVSRDYLNPASQAHVITFTQVFGGLDAVFGGRLNVSVTHDGRILNYTGNPRPSAGLSARPRLSIASAVAAVARSNAPGAAYHAAVTGRSGVWTRFARGPFGGPQYARAAAFPTTKGVRPAYEVIFTASTSDMTDVAVDAVTGKILYRQPLTSDYSDIGANAADALSAATAASAAAPGAECGGETERPGRPGIPLLSRRPRRTRSGA